MRKSAMGVLGLVTGMALTTVGGIVASVGNTYADGVEFSATVESSMNITLTADTVSLNLNPANAAFASQTLTASVGTNNLAGYTMTMSSANDATVLSRTEAISGSTPTIATLASAVSESNFPANRWGYRFDSGNYQPYASGMTYSSSLTAVNPEDSAKTITFGAKVDTDQPYGTYELDLVFTAVPRTITYNVNYYGGIGSDGKDSTGISSLPATQSGAGTDSSIAAITLSSTQPTRDGYTFGDWCSVAPTVAADGSSTCSGTTYAPGGTYNLNYQAGEESVGLYALWLINPYTCTKRYRLQAANGTYGDYTTETTEQVNFGSTCTYTKTVTDYNNNTAMTTSGTMTSSGITLSLDFPRNTYTLTVDRNTTYIGSVTGAGTYRWGQGVGVSATASSGNKFTAWSQTAGTGQGGTTNFADSTSSSTTFTMPKSNATIYADGEADILYMQQWTGCSSMTIGDTTTLVDRRDSKEYTVGRLKDGNCWLLENLQLELDTVTLDNLKGTSSAPNTNATDTSLTYLKNGSGSSPYTTAAVANISSGFTSYTAAMINKSYGSYNMNSTWSYGSGSGKQGIYYNYCAASAGSYCYASGSGTGNASQDICPAGWHMPTGDTAKGSYYYLYNNTTEGYSANAANFKNALRAPLSGYFYSSSAGNQGSSGRFWSSTRSDGSNMYYLRVDSSNVGPLNYYGRYSGFSVRCVTD